MTGMVWLGLCIFLAWTIEAMSGFGSIVIALSLGALLLPMEVMLPTLVALNVLTSAWLVWQHRQYVDKQLLWRRILPAMFAGTVAGALLRDQLPAVVLKAGFALLILWFALRELWLIHHQRLRPPHREVITQGLIGAAGITHGLFASGGPLLVYALAGSGIGKAPFRATLITVWLSLNGVLLAMFLWQGRIAEVLWPTAAYVPVVVVAVWLGNRLHQGLDEQRFRHLVFRLLALVGGALLVTQLLQFAG